MQKIRIIIKDGRAQRVEITGTSKLKSDRDIYDMLRSMPKSTLAEALNINQKEESSVV